LKVRSRNWTSTEVKQIAQPEKDIRLSQGLLPNKIILPPIQSYRNIH
jgi:hypothetical protein